MLVQGLELKSIANGALNWTSSLEAVTYTDIHKINESNMGITCNWSKIMEINSRKCINNKHHGCKGHVENSLARAEIKV